MLPSFTNEGTKHFDNIPLFRFSKIEWYDLIIQERIFDAPPVIMFNHVFKGCESSIMHIGSGSRNFTQRRRLERANIFFIFGHIVPPHVERFSTPAYSNIVELFIGEVGSKMA